MMRGGAAYEFADDERFGDWLRQIGWHRYNFAMPQKIRVLKAALRKAGFNARSGKGSHSVWTHPKLSAREDAIVLAGNDGDDAKPYQTRDVNRALQKLEALSDE